MSNLKKILTIGYPTLKIELFLVFGWLLLAPEKEGVLYHLISSSLILLIIGKEIFLKKNLSYSTFTICLTGIITLILLFQFFSVVPFSSLLIISDLILIALFFIIYPGDQYKHNFFDHILYIISLFSLILILNSIFGFIKPDHLFFINPIMKSAVSSIGLVISFSKLLEKVTIFIVALFLLNLSSLYILGSKSAFIASTAVLFFLFLKKRKNLLKYLLIMIALTIIIPNPVKKSFIFFIKKDPYAFERINIWKSGLKMCRSHLPFGTGLGNYSKVSPQFNFKTGYAPANYLKYPRRPHSDYVLLLSETGILGLILIVLFISFLIKKFFSSGLNLPLSLLILIAIQSCFYNLIFQLPILFLIICLLRFLQTPDIRYISFSKFPKLLLSLFLVFLYLGFYLFPFLSEHHQQKITHSETPFKRLNNASLLTPLDYNIYYKKAQIWFSLFKKTPDWQRFFMVKKNINKVKTLNPYFKANYILESELFLNLGKRMNIKYPNLKNEIITPLNQAEHFFPFDPFIKFQKALIFHQFSDLNSAQTCAIASLEVEPDFILPHWFLYENYTEFNNQKRLETIKSIVKRHHLPYNGDKVYLMQLFALPDSLKDILNTDENM